MCLRNHPRFFSFLSSSSLFKLGLVREKEAMPLKRRKSPQVNVEAASSVLFLILVEWIFCH